jgi:hypothetical protein
MNSQSHIRVMNKVDENCNKNREDEFQSVWERELVKTTVDSQLRASYISPPSHSSEIVSTLLPTLFSSFFFLCASLFFPYRESHVTPRRLPPNNQTHTQVLLSGAPSNRLLGSLMLNYHFFFFKEKQKKVFFFFSNESVLFFSAGFSTCRVHVGGNATIGFEKGM